MINRKYNQAVILLTVVCSFTFIDTTAQHDSRVSNYAAQQGALSATIGQKTEGVISKQELLNANQLSVVAPYETLYSVSSFTLTRVRLGENPVEAKNTGGADLTDSMKEIIRNSLPGDKLYFEYIKCKGPDGSIRSLGALSFKIE